MQAALRAVGVPAVVGGTESVFGSPSARHWLRLLEALEQPASRPRAVAVALTPFVGMTADDVAAADEATWEAVHARLHRWAAILRQRGVADRDSCRSLAAEGLPARLLVQPTGERDLTDLGHIAELLHAEASTGQLGPPALRAWLARRTEEVGVETADAEDRSRRLDSDADAVQVLTIHRAKGLEFPVVYCPYLWDSGLASAKRTTRRVPRRCRRQPTHPGRRCRGRLPDLHSSISRPPTTSSGAKTCVFCMWRSPEPDTRW